MALPLVKTLSDCGDFSKTVEPFISQLYVLPARVLDTITSPDGLQQLYIQTNPLISGFAISVALGAVFLVLSEVNKNYSQVDRMWSILPNLYIWHLAVWARLAGAPHSRIDLIAAFTAIWSCRLTFNYWRRGGYNVGSEDYRWEIIQKYVPGFIFFIFNVTFISFIQSILLFAFSCVPAYAILVSTQFKPDIGALDLAFFAIEVGLVVSEWFSDGQQWSYQTAKYKYRDDGKVPQKYSKAELDRGFATSGMWAYSRHPNFFAEQSIWFVLSQWACLTTNNLYSWIIGPSIALVALFQGSTWLTEIITSGKYPEYAEYKRQVGRFFPTSFRPYTPPQQKETRKQK